MSTITAIVSEKKTGTQVSGATVVATRLNHRPTETETIISGDDGTFIMQIPWSGEEGEAYALHGK
jgi:hypothetical protein